MKNLPFDNIQFIKIVSSRKYATALFEGTYINPKLNSSISNKQLITYLKSTVIKNMNWRDKINMMNDYVSKLESTGISYELEDKSFRYLSFVVKSISDGIAQIQIKLKFRLSNKEISKQSNLNDIHDYNRNILLTSTQKKLSKLGVMDGNLFIPYQFISKYKIKNYKPIAKELHTAMFIISKTKNPNLYTFLQKNQSEIYKESKKLKNEYSKTASTFIATLILSNKDRKLLNTSIGGLPDLYKILSSYDTRLSKKIISDFLNLYELAAIQQFYNQIANLRLK